MKISVRLIIVSVVLQVNLCLSSWRASKKSSKGKEASGDHEILSQISSRGIASKLLVVTEITSNDHCFVKGVPYVLTIKFRNVIDKTWVIKLNGTQLHTTRSILFEFGLIANIILNQGLYIGLNSYGDTALSINITSGSESKEINKTICVRLKTNKVRVSAVKATLKGTPVTFYVYSAALVGTRNIYILFTEGSSTTKVTSSDKYQISHTYRIYGSFKYTWRVTTNVYVAEGSGTINVVRPVGQSANYTFQPVIQKYWPDNRVIFEITRKCGVPSPTSAFYRLNFGDGEVANWQKLKANLACNVKIKLRGHTYDQAGCYNTVFELRNPLGRFTLKGKVNILQRINDIKIVARSISTPVPVQVDKLGTKMFYVQDVDPFNVTAITTGGRCRKFEWKILSPHWKKETTEVNSIIVKHLVKRTGTYDFEVKVKNSNNSVTKRVKIIVSKSLFGLSLLSNTTGRDRNATFYLLVEGWSPATIFKWTFGDGQSEIANYSSLLPATSLPKITQVSGASKIDLKKRLGVVKEYTYSSNGLYNVTLTATDIFRTLVAKRNVFISYSHCLRPEVRIAKQKGSKVLVFNLGETFTIVTYVSIDCDDSNQAVFRWTLIKSSTLEMDSGRVSESDKIVSFPAHIITNQREITIRKRSIPPGVYILRLTVYLENLGYSDSDEKYLKLNEEPIHVRIEGGSFMLLSWESEIVLNGSGSYDPNVINGNVNDLDFKWYCKVKPGALPFKIGSGGCFGFGDNIIEANTPIWRVQPQAFVRNAVYIITLNAENKKVRRRRASYRQIIEVRAGAVMNTPIRCIANCGIKLDPQTRLSLIGNCSNCGKFANYSWSLHTADSKIVPLKWLEDTRTPKYSMSFVLVPTKLSRSVEYFARYTVVTPTGETGYRQYGFSLSRPPYGGYCASNPKSGSAIVTYFSISCYDWKGESTTLKYSVSLINRAARAGELKDDSDSSILSYGHVPTVSTTLPEGTKERNYKQELAIRIIDSYGSSTTVRIQVKVLPFNIKSSKGAEDVLGKYLYGRNSTLSKIVGSGDFQALGRLANAFGKTLDTVKQITSDSLAQTVKQTKEQKRTKMRQTLIDSLTKVSITTLENFSLVSNGLKSVSVTESEVNKHSQKKMMNFYESTSDFMTKSYSKWTERDPQTIQDAVGGFIKGVGNMMDASVLTRSNNNLKRTDYLQFVHKSLNILDSSSSLLFQSIAPNEIARRVVSKAMTVEVKKLEGIRFDNMLVDTVGGGKVRSPSRRSLTAANKSIVDFKLVSLKRNPFTWDRQSIGKMLTPTITNVKLLSDQKEINVKNMPPGDELRVEIPTPKTSLANFSTVLRGEIVSTFCNYLPNKEISAMVKTRCVGSPCHVYVSYHGKPSPKNYAENYTVEDSSKSRGEKFKLFSKAKSTRMCIGIQKVQKNMTGKFNSTFANKTVNAYLDLFLTGCFYWNTAKGVWSSDGCKISDGTSVKKTICLCNHLTWFGAGILVKPNVIDITKESLKLLNLKDYPALLATVCVIGGIYLLAMVWARRKDKKDVLKTGLMIAPDCCQTHSYRYDVTIYTGSRPYSGTTSAVCIILGGSLDKSAPHCLSDSQEEVFKRGDVDTFLVTSATDLGKISWMRIWIDNSGNNPTWYVSRIIVTDLLNNQQTTFLCQSWLGVGISDGTVDKTFVAAGDDELKGFETIFLAQTSRGFCDDHLWFSITMRPPRSHFSRCQRVSCCLCILLCTMLANAMFYQTNVFKQTKLSIGSVSFSWRQIVIGIQSALVVLPVNILVVTLFRKAAPSVKIEVELLSDVLDKANVSNAKLESAVGSSAANKKTAFESQSKKSSTSMKRIPSIAVYDENACTTPEKVQNKSKTRQPGPSKDDKVQQGAKSGSSQSFIPVPVCRTYATQSSFECLRNDPSGSSISSRSRVNEIPIDDPYIRKKLMSKARKKVKRLSKVYQSEAEFGKKSSSKADKKKGNSKRQSKSNRGATEESRAEGGLSSKAKTKGHAKPQDVTIEITEDDKMKKSTEKSAYWPHFCMYIAWFICVTASVAAGYFTLLYGLSFGKAVQEKWLLSFFTSVFQDVFISQPVKVVLLGCIIAFIFKTLWVDDKLPEVELAKSDEWIKSHLPVQDKSTTATKSMIPLSESYVRMMHLNRLEEMRLTNIAVEVVVYLFYIFLVLLIAYGHRSPNAYFMTKDIKDLMISRRFEEVKDVVRYWNWIDNTFLPSFYGKAWYNAKMVKQKGFLDDYVTYVIGSPMIRQLRVVPGKCPYAVWNYFRNTTCEGAYGEAEKSYRNYGRGWRNDSSASAYGTFKVEKTLENPWTYKSEKELKSHRFMGKLHTYPGGGYVRTLGKTMEEARSTIQYLKKHLWIDSLTRAVFLEFTTYNNNDNFFSIVTLVIECIGTGGAVPFSQIVTTRLDRYNSTFSFFLAACEVSFLLLSFYYIWLETKKAKKKGGSYFKKIGGIIELLIFSMTWAALGLLIVRLSVVKWTKSAYKSNPNGFTSFQFAASSDLAYGYVIGAVVFVVFLKMLKVLRSSKNMLMLLQTLQYSAIEMRNYFVFFAVAFAAFMFWANLAFGRYDEGHPTFVRSCMSIFNLLLGRAQFKFLYSANRSIAPIFFILYTLSMNIFLINIFITILCDAFTRVRVEMAEQPNKYNIFEFVFNRLMSFCPCLMALQKRESPRKQQKPSIKKLAKYLSSVETKVANVDNMIDKVLQSEYKELKDFCRFALYKRWRTTGRKPLKSAGSKSPNYLDVKGY